MKLQTTLTFGLALALLGTVDSRVVAEPAQAAAGVQPVAFSYNTPTPPSAQPPAAAPATGYGRYAAQRPAYGYPGAPASSYPLAPANPAAPVAAAQPVVGQYPNYQPALTTQPALPAAPAQVTAGLGGYPTAPVRVAQAPPAPQGSGTRSEVVSPGTPVLAAPGAPVPPSATHGYPSAESWSGYTAPPSAGCATGDCATGNCGQGVAPGHACGPGGCGIGIGSGGSALDLTGALSGGSSRQWFFGLYGLLLDRVDTSSTFTAFELATPPAAGGGLVYPDASVDRIFATGDVGSDIRGGAEIRFGSTLGSAVDPCNGACYQPFAWEFGYWGITDDPDQAVLIDVGGTTDPDRIYGARDYSGLQYDRNGAGFRPLNDYYDFQVPADPASTNDLRVLAVRVRTNFEAQNLELNFWRFGSPFEGVAAGGGCANGACGYDTCGASCGPAPKRFFISALAGLRYFRTDETLETAVLFAAPTDTIQDYPGGFDPNQSVFDELNIDNELVGFQIGCSLNRLVGCNWTLFCDSNFGVYNNSVDKYQRIFAAGGPIQFTSSGQDALIRSSENTVAFLGELRCGAAYQVTPRCRLTAAWRAIASSGVATAEGQLQPSFASIEQARQINTNGSIILHGLQAGIETKF